jgi:hypothetical protein
MEIVCLTGLFYFKLLFFFFNYFPSSHSVKIITTVDMLVKEPSEMGLSCQKIKLQLLLPLMRKPERLRPSLRHRKCITIQEVFSPLSGPISTVGVETPKYPVKLFFNMLAKTLLIQGFFSCFTQPFFFFNYCEFQSGQFLALGEK